MLTPRPSIRRSRWRSDAELEVTSTRGDRRIPAADFFQGTLSTALQDDELLVAVHCPVWAGRSGFAFDEVVRRHGDFALVGAAAGIQLDRESVIQRAAIAMLGVEGRPHRASEAEASLIGTSVDRIDPSDVGQLALEVTQPMDDIHASARYRRQVGAHVVGRALSVAAARAAALTEQPTDD